jgi:hypothetical protein
MSESVELYAAAADARDTSRGRWSHFLRDPPRTSRFAVSLASRGFFIATLPAAAEAGGGSDGP